MEQAQPFPHPFRDQPRHPEFVKISDDLVLRLADIQSLHIGEVLYNSKHYHGRVHMRGPAGGHAAGNVWYLTRKQDVDDLQRLLLGL